MKSWLYSKRKKICCFLTMGVVKVGIMGLLMCL